MHLSNSKNNLSRQMNYLNLKKTPYIFTNIVLMFFIQSSTAGHTTSKMIVAAAPYCNQNDYKIHAALQAGSDLATIQELIVTEKHNLNKRAFVFGYTPLELACISNHKEQNVIIASLVKHGAEVNFYKSPLLQKFTQSHKVEKESAN